MIRTLFSIFIFFIWGIVICQGQINITAISSPVSQNFDVMGTSATALLPTGFRVSAGTDYSVGTTSTTESGGTAGAGALNAGSTGGVYNFANGITGSATDRALGFLSSGSFSSPRSIMVLVINNTGVTITSFNLSFDYEKYRSGSRAFDWTFFHGNDGVNWASATAGDQSYIADAGNTVVNPPTSITKSFTVSGLAIPNGTSYYFRWTYTGNGGSTNGQALGIDNFSVTAFTSSITSSNASDHFRTKQSGDWGVPSIWESSADGSTWINSTLIPTSSANTISIQNSHTINIVSAVIADQLTIQNGGTLNHVRGINFTLADGSGTDMLIWGTYIINGSMPIVSSLTNYVVESTGVIQAATNTTPYLESDNIAFSNNTYCLFKTGSIFEWATSTIFETVGIIYFSSATERPIFKITGSVGTVGSNSNTEIRGLLQVDGSVTFDNTGTKIFREGIIGSGTITSTGGGILQITGTDAQLGGTGIITLNSSSLQIASGAQVLLSSHKTINGSTFTNNGTFNCQAYVISGSTNFTHSGATATLGIGSADGISSTGNSSGNIQSTGTRTFNSNANYLYNGNSNQITGNGLPSTVSGLSISNTGVDNDNTVTLTTNNTITTILSLNDGYFASGLNQTLRIAVNGIIYGTGGGNPNDPTAGNIEFIGSGSTNGNATGNPNLYSVIANGGIDFNGNPDTWSATIMNSLQLNAGSFLVSAPFYANGSSLVYNTGGTYGRNVEWGNAAGLQGYPHHVTVQNNTILDLNSNPISQPQLAMGGDFTIGNISSWGRVYMNAGMNKPLSVGGSLTIGSMNAASNSSELYLSAAISGDLWLYGSFTRYNGSFYTDNDRAIFFKGSANASINTPNVPGSPSQYFSYAILDKAIGTETITLNCPVGINKSITFTKGIILASINNPLVVIDNATSIGGGILSFVDGPMKKIGNDDFVFPVGDIVPGTDQYRTIGISGLSANLSFTAEFRRENATNLGPVTAPGPPPLVRVSACEYWTLARTEAAGIANVTLTWSTQSPCNTASYVSDLSTLVIAHGTGTPLIANSGVWDSYGGLGNATGTTTAGSITWNGVGTFSPFSLGSVSIKENILPLDLSSFTAKARKNDVLIDWNVMNNNDQEEYILEHSKDGVNFKTLKVVPAKVILNQAAYTELDQKPFKGWNYYRLRVIDKAGEAKVSHVVKVWFGINELIRISPNPASEKIVINLSEPSSISSIELVNISGQVLKRINNIQFITEINISQMQAGLYYIRIQGKNGQASKTFVKY